MVLKLGVLPIINGIIYLPITTDLSQTGELNGDLIGFEVYAYWRWYIQRGIKWIVTSK